MSAARLAATWTRCATRGEVYQRDAQRAFWHQPAPTLADRITALRREVAASLHVSHGADLIKAEAVAILDRLATIAASLDDAGGDPLSMAEALHDDAINAMCAADERQVVEDAAEWAVADRRFGNGDVA